MSSRAKAREPVPSAGPGPRPPGARKAPEFAGTAPRPHLRSGGPWQSCREAVRPRGLVQQMLEGLDTFPAACWLRPHPWGKRETDE